ncbi:MAG: ferrochelatase, partial [Rhizobiaceae bacterium]|nr:ferrochelatase [Rhizobiaceae bacterium]
MNIDPRLMRNAAKAVGPLPGDHPQVRIGKVGVLLVNLGTPDAPTAPALRRYLRQFLSDSRVIEWPKALWYPILYGIVLNTRPKRVAKA